LASSYCIQNFKSHNSSFGRSRYIVRIQVSKLDHMTGMTLITPPSRVDCNSWART